MFSVDPSIKDSSYFKYNLFSGGTTGYTGVIGPTGLQGPQGPQGLAGTATNTGATGSPGETGPTGYTGLQGPAGDTTNTGATGDIGPTGYTGPQGPAGDTTNTGATGDIGPTGYTGLQGPAGDTTNTGAMGDIGPTGYTGPQGPAGVSSTVGSFYSTETGPRGDTGPSTSFLPPEPISGYSRTFPLVQVLPWGSFFNIKTALDSTNWDVPGYSGTNPGVPINPGVYAIQIGTPDLSGCGYTGPGIYKLVNFDTNAFIIDQTSSDYVARLRLEGLTMMSGLYNIHGAVTFPIDTYAQFAKRGIIVTIGVQNYLATPPRSYISRVFSNESIMPVGVEPDAFQTISFNITQVIDNTLFSTSSDGLSSDPYCDINVGVINSVPGSAPYPFGYYNNEPLGALQSGNIAIGTGGSQPVHNTMGDIYIGGGGTEATAPFITQTGTSYLSITKLAQYQV